MKIEWTDEACKAAMYAQKITTDHPIDQWREILNAATAVQFAPETAAEKVKRYEEAMRVAADGLANFSSTCQVGNARDALWAALSYRKGA